MQVSCFQQKFGFTSNIYKLYDLYNVTCTFEEYTVALISLGPIKQSEVQAIVPLEPSATLAFLVSKELS